MLEQSCSSALLVKAWTKIETLCSTLCSFVSVKAKLDNQSSWDGAMSFSSIRSNSTLLIHIHIWFGTFYIYSWSLEIMRRSVENNNRSAHIIPVTCKCSVSISQCFCLSLRQGAAATQQLPNDVALVVIIYWGHLSPQGGRGDLLYLRCKCFHSRWCAQAQLLMPSLPRAISILQPDYPQSLKICFPLKEHNRFINTSIDVCCVCVCVSLFIGCI